MKLSAVLLAVVAAQDDDRWSFYDYSIPADGKVGHAVSGLGMTNMGGHEGNRRYCHSTLDTQKIYRWDVTKNGFFAHFNPVECLGEELFCTIEERAHYGQIIGIRAGCAQMMNHPQVATAAPITVAPELKNHYNQEAARGNSFTTGGGGVSIFYGIGGCLALPAQNGWKSNNADFSGSLSSNYFMATNGGYGMNQCLRFQRSMTKMDLLPFGVSVCRTCCNAVADFFNAGNGVCNFWPYGATGRPSGIDQSVFACTTAAGAGCTYDGSNAGSVSDCDVCSKQMFPNFSMYDQPAYDGYTNVFEIDSGGGAFCATGTCTPEIVHGGGQQIAGGR